MHGTTTSKSDTTGKDRQADGRAGAAWPAWARRLASAVLAFHLVGLLAGAMVAPPSSFLEQDLERLFARYHHWIDQGYTYRYYAPEPGPTPIATATIHYADGRPDETVRIPERGVFPRLRYQRQLALANHLTNDFQAARAETGDGARSRWAQSYARHLARTHPGCATITLYSQIHLIPELERVRQAQAEPGRRGVDLDAEEFFTTPERIGEFSCDAF